MKFAQRPLSLVIILGLALLIWGADQWSKHIVLQGFLLGDTTPVIEGYFNITLVHNTGAAMGLLVGQNKALTILSLAAIIGLILFRHSFVTSHREHLFAIGLIAGGILGNLTDRLRFGYVVDFLHFHWQGKAHWYVFNIADAAICVGVFSYIIALAFAPQPASPNKPEEKQAAPSAP